MPTPSRRPFAPAAGEPNPGVRLDRRRRNLVGVGPGWPERRQPSEDCCAFVNRSETSAQLTMFHNALTKSARTLRYCR